MCGQGRRTLPVVGKTPPRAADGFVQYEFIEGFARHTRDALPHASFVGFTGTQGLPARR